MYFVFRATESKSYTFYSTGSYDTYGYLYDANQFQIVSNDDSNGISNSNFSMTYSLTAGETVYLVVRMFSQATTGTFTVYVK